jgi:predicted ArsR family transcriptional regulator
MKDRLLFLLREAGPHRACELAAVLGTTTGETQQALRDMEREGLVACDEIGNAIRWAAVGSPPAPESTR